MLLTWLKHLTPRRSTRSANSRNLDRRRSRPRVEGLEDRVLPSLFGPPVNLAAGSSPNSVAVGDFTGAGTPDLAVANSSSNTVSVLLGNGNGTFQNAVNYNVGSSPQAVAVGDFTGAGTPDLAVANHASNTVSVLLGNGNGTLQNAVNYNAGTNPSYVAVGDFTGDGKLDLAVANAGSANVSVLLNGLADSTTSLQASVNPPVAGQPIVLTATVQPAILGLGLGTPTGPVVFQDGNTILGTSPLLDGTATLSDSLSAGSQQVTASYQGNPSYYSPSSASLELNVAPFGAPAAISTSGGCAQNTPIGSAFGTLVQAEVTDAFGNPVADVPVTFSAPASGASGSFDASATVPTNALGVATAPAFTANQVQGSFTVTATVAGVAKSAPFSLTNTAIPAAIKLAAGSPQKATVGTAFTTPLEVKVTTAQGQAVSGITVVFALPGSGPGGTVDGSAAVLTNASGVATAPALTANTTAGSFTVLASVAGVAGAVPVSLTNTAGAPATISAFAGTPQNATVNKVYKPLEAKVLDVFGNPVSGVKVGFTAPGSTGASGTFAGKATATAATAANGVAIAPAFTANTKAGSYTVSASVAGVTPSASFSLTNVAGPAVRIAVVTTATPQSRGAGSASGGAFVLAVQVTDAFDNPVGNVVVTFTVRPSATTGSGATFSDSLKATATTDTTGLATAPALTANSKPGSFTVVASIFGLPVEEVFSLTIT